MVGFNIGVPVDLTRRGLYLTTIVAAVVFVLFPFSCIGYYEFYRSLIPTPSPRVPLNFYKSDLAMFDLGSKTSPLRHYQFDPLFNYNWHVNLDLVCGDGLLGKLVQLEWLVWRDRDEAFSDTFILDCETSYIHHANNWFVPYKLRYWVPPLVVDITRQVPVDLSKFVLLGQFFTTSSDYTIRVESVPGLVINNDKLYLDFQMEFSGFRYYLHKYRLLCAAAGVALFWWINSTLAVITSLLVLGVDNNNEWNGADDDLMSYDNNDKSEN